MKVIIFDTSVLSPFARAGRLGVLDSLTRGARRCITSHVEKEIEEGISRHRKLSQIQKQGWLHAVRLEESDELKLFAAYVRRLGSKQSRNLGEASVLAYAEVHGHVAICDDETAVRIARSRGVEVRRTLALMIEGVRKGMLTEARASRLLEELVQAGGRYPCQGQELFSWARMKGLL